VIHATGRVRSDTSEASAGTPGILVHHVGACHLRPSAQPRVTD
jgi:hypothetical protein